MEVGVAQRTLPSAEAEHVIMKRHDPDRREMLINEFRFGHGYPGESQFAARLFTQSCSFLLELATDFTPPEGWISDLVFEFLPHCFEIVKQSIHFVEVMAPRVFWITMTTVARATVETFPEYLRTVLRISIPVAGALQVYVDKQNRALLKPGEMLFWANISCLTFRVLPFQFDPLVTDPDAVVTHRSISDIVRHHPNVRHHRHRYGNTIRNRKTHP
ncbi:hypothetical protein 2 [Beihai shrimp virus 6]|uniref:hypothetical protein 2 n=1 Tax=Beihai shrimp virus 6 TaxID=1922672 RepID=UPI000909DAAB|nr:hypothetical protein 2 [Beihai shrimp virus 6]APG76115.1 hypothetical protein 2 [Beihai shrimp virus 6]APG76158.1 hypothetical protein 2 [Beihai shrimp virus 6]